MLLTEHAQTDIHIQTHTYTGRKKARKARNEEQAMPALSFERNQGSIAREKGSKAAGCPSIPPIHSKVAALAMPSAQLIRAVQRATIKQNRMPGQENSRRINREQKKNRNKKKTKKKAKAKAKAKKKSKKKAKEKVARPQLPSDWQSTKRYVLGGARRNELDHTFWKGVEDRILGKNHSSFVLQMEEQKHREVAKEKERRRRQ